MLFFAGALQVPASASRSPSSPRLCTLEPPRGRGKTRTAPTNHLQAFRNDVRPQQITSMSRYVLCVCVYLARGGTSWRRVGRRSTPTHSWRTSVDTSSTYRSEWGLSIQIRGGSSQNRPAAVCHCTWERPANEIAKDALNYFLIKSSQEALKQIKVNEICLKSAFWNLIFNNSVKWI